MHQGAHRSHGSFVESRKPISPRRRENFADVVFLVWQLQKAQEELLETLLEGELGPPTPRIGLLEDDDQIRTGGVASLVLYVLSTTTV